MSSNSTFTPIRAILTTQDILAAYEAHGDDCMIIDIDNLRKTTYAQYGDIFIKKANGEIVHPRYWKLSGQGITTSSAIKEPSKRSYAQTRIGVCQLAKINDEQVETDNMKAMKLICELYEKQMEQLKEKKIITDNDKAPRKQPDGTQRPVYFMSTKIVSPMDTVIIDRETGEAKDREYPYYWLSIPQKRFYNADETKKESVHFNDQYYFDADKKGPDFTKPIMTFSYAPTFFNIDNFIHHPRTGKKVYKKLGSIDDDESEPLLDNTNIHKYLTKGTAMVGNIKFELVIAGRQAKMEISLYGSMYVRQGTYSQSEEQDDDCLDEFSNRYANMTVTKKQVDEDLDEPDLDDF
jgi:hypothetical protein